jgi:ribosomal subunit interface protein
MIDIQITGVRYDVSDKVKAYVHEKLGSLTRFSLGLHLIQVTIHEGDKFGYRVDVDMHLPNHKDVVAHDSEETVYSAIDVVADKCAAQLRKLHDRQTHDKRSKSDARLKMRA